MTASPEMTTHIADKYTKDGKLFLSIFRNPNNTTTIIRTNAVRGLHRLTWRSELSPETWITNNATRSKNQWKFRCSQ